MISQFESIVSGRIIEAERKHAEIDEVLPMNSGEAFSPAPDAIPEIAVPKAACSPARSLTVVVTPQ